MLMIVKSRKNAGETGDAVCCDDMNVLCVKFLKICARMPLKIYFHSPRLWVAIKFPFEG